MSFRTLGPQPSASAYSATPTWSEDCSADLLERADARSGGHPVSLEHERANGTLLFDRRAVELAADEPTFRLPSSPTGDDRNPERGARDLYVHASDLLGIDAPIDP